MIGDEINCLKNVGLIQLKEATSYCKLFNANQILPRSRQESNDLIAALSSLDLDSQNNETLVSIDIYKTKEGEWHDSAGQPISYFNWLPDQLDYLSENLNYAGFRINGINESVGWAKLSGTNELNVVCTQRAGHGKSFEKKIA